MTTAEKITLVKGLLDNDTEATDAVISIYLIKAGAAILRRLYQFGAPEGASVPVEYDILQCELAQRYFLRRGSEGEISHSEPDISRHYGSVNDADLLSEVIPYARVSI